MMWLRRNSWWIKRLCALPVQLMAFAVCVFFLIRTIPGDPVDMVTGGQHTAASYLKVQKQLGLDGTVWDQFQRYMLQLLHFDLGRSLTTGRAVMAELSEKLPETLELTLIAMTGVIALALIGSYRIVMLPDRLGSRILRAYARSAGAIPEFVLGILAIFLFYATLNIAPPPIGRFSPYLDAPHALTGFPVVDVLLSGRLNLAASALGYLALPIGVMILAQAPVLLKLLSADLERAIDSEATRFRLASGADPRAVMMSIYRRALPSSVTMVGIMFGNLFGGAIIIESLFSIDGMGRYSTEAVLSDDLTAIQGIILVGATLSVFVYLLTDVANMLLDPRRRAGLGPGG
jgi:peptide/nickel transport system permease protein